MQFIPIAHDSDDFQQGLTAEQIQAVCNRAFGPSHVESTRELAGGEHNNVHLVRITGREPVILRIAPAADRLMPGRELYSLRQEYGVLPYLAALAPLLPTTLAVDFTGQVIPRDYLFQMYMPGERWFDVAKELAPVHHFRRLIYNGMHQGNVLAHVACRGPQELLLRIRAMQAHMLADLRVFAV